MNEFFGFCKDRTSRIYPISRSLCGIDDSSICSSSNSNFPNRNNFDDFVTKYG